MQQLTQKLKTGAMSVMEVPCPALNPGTILVKNHYSLISAGTEGSTVKAARKGYIGKAKERPQQVKQVLDTLRSQGIIQTYRAVMKKLDAQSPLGYSCAGEVIGVGSGVRGFNVGDLAACGGAAACHAEIVAVPVNLCVKLHPGGELKQAAYNTLGAIALQGVRQADLRLGETCAVIGLGLIGQLAAMLLRSSGVRVIGIDVNQNMVDLALKNCLDLGMNRKDSDIEDRIYRFTNGIGCDAIIITAASDSLDPINFAGAVSRKKGTVVVLGAVPTGYDREPHYYQKELQVRMSCSYGPGRYDSRYEEKGYDYPPAYVRWTENRNMQAFQELIAGGKINVGYLTTHTFPLEKAFEAYDMMMAKSEPFVGILIEYDASKPFEAGATRIELTPSSLKSAHVSIGFIGAGSYAQSYLLPNLPDDKNIFRCGVMTSSSAGARSAADRFGFGFCTGNENDIIGNHDINTVFIASRHDSHARYVLKALAAGKHVFVEKPLCLTENELHEIASVYQSKADKPQFMVGFNRRFSPFARAVKEFFGSGPLAMNYRINAGKIPASSWIQDPETGGGRIIGEVCHFVDLLTYLSGSLPVSVYAVSVDDCDGLDDILTIAVKYRNQSVGSISYFSNGDKSLSKEYLEVYGNRNTAILDDFRSLKIHSRGKKTEKKLFSQDKGQKQEIVEFINAIRSGSSAISFDEIFSTTLLTFKIIESLRTGLAIRL
ncbi:MAG: bi-domain-containing oxidoreductase [Smithellaceae bacterium]|nr:bi-domain-containing oxidoreductase [Smithellaceae bacterium]